MAMFLAWESRSLLLGETADPKTVRAIQALIRKNPHVDEVRRPLTMHFGPRQILLNVDVQFRPNLSAAELVKVIDDLEADIHRAYPAIRQIFIEVEGLKGYGDGQESP